MALITTIPLRIGDERRPPGYRLNEDDLIGRNVAGMLKAGHVMVAPDEPGDSKPSRRAAKAVAPDEPGDK